MDFGQLLSSLSEEVKTQHPELVQAIQAASELQAKYAAAQEELNQWQQWRANNWDDAAGKTKAEAALQAELEQLAAENEALRAQLLGSPTTPASQPSSAPPATPSQVRAAVSQLAGNYLTEEQARALVNQLLAERVTTQQLNQAIAEATNSIVKAVANVLPRSLDAFARHMREFGEPLEASKLMEYMQKNNITDPIQAWEQMVAPIREERRQREIEQKIKEAEQRGAERAKQELAMSMTKVPVDMTGSPALAMQAGYLGHPKEEDGVPEDVQLGEGRLAQFMLADLQRQGKL